MVASKPQDTKEDRGRQAAWRPSRERLNAFHLLTQARYWYQTVRYKAPADPYKVIAADLETIRYEEVSLNRKIGLGQIKGGDWRLKPLEGQTIYKGLVQRFVEGRDWEETLLFKNREQKLAEHGTYMGYADIDDWRVTRGRYLDALYETMRTKGYRPNYEAGHDTPEEGARRGVYKQSLEPWVVIDRDGAMHWTEGFHRLSLAKILGVEAIPVQVMARHKDWQQVREAMHGAPLDALGHKLAQHVDHPDLADILEDEA